MTRIATSQNKHRCTIYKSEQIKKVLSDYIFLRLLVLIILDEFQLTLRTQGRGV